MEPLYVNVCKRKGDLNQLLHSFLIILTENIEYAAQYTRMYLMPQWVRLVFFYADIVSIVLETYIGTNLYRISICSDASESIFIHMIWALEYVIVGISIDCGAAASNAIVCSDSKWTHPETNINATTISL